MKTRIRLRAFYDFYQTPRGEFTPEGGSPERTTHPTLSSNGKFMNFYPFSDIETIAPRAMLFGGDSTIRFVKSSAENPRTQNQCTIVAPPETCRGRVNTARFHRAFATTLLQEITMEIEITRNGSQPSTRGPADWFTGSVRIDPLFSAKESTQAAAALVTFEPGARTAWHTHPRGQTLIVTSGLGWVQREGGPVQEIRPGDVVWFPPGMRHWHGAAPNTAMAHIAIQEHQNGKVVDWLEHVTDAQYQR